MLNGGMKPAAALPAHVLLARLFSASREEWIGKPAPVVAHGDWLNPEPLTLSELKGNVAVLQSARSAVTILVTRPLPMRVCTGNL